MKKRLLCGILLLILLIAFWQWRAGTLLINTQDSHSVDPTPETPSQARARVDDQRDAGDVRDLPAFERSDNWYLENGAFDITDSCPFNFKLTVGLGVSSDELKSLSNCLLPVAIRLNRKGKVIVSDGIRTEDPGRPGFTAYRISPLTEIRDADAVAEVQESFKAILGDKRGTELFRRVSRAAEGDPYLRGFGTSTLILYMEPLSTNSPHVRWQYEVFRADGSLVGRGERNSVNRLPPPFQELFHIEEYDTDSSAPGASPLQ